MVVVVNRGVPAASRVFADDRQKERKKNERKKETECVLTSEWAFAARFALACAGGCTRGLAGRRGVAWISGCGVGKANTRERASLECSLALFG